jgi:hypothetical protein
MTWSEMITINADTSLDKKQVIGMFYRLGTPHPGKDLADIALLCSPDATGDFCIRLTWQGAMPEQGKSSFGARLAEAFSKRGRAHHAVWQREGSLVLMNSEPIDPSVEHGTTRVGGSR